MRYRLLLSFAFLAGLLAAFPAMAWDCASDEPAMAETGKPTPRHESWWPKLAEDVAVAAKWQHPKIVFMGDSLTHRWPDNLWQKEFVPRQAVNFGIDGDRTANLLWRYQNSDDEVRKAPFFVVLIGTNDLGWGNTPRDTADGIRVLLHEILHQSPQAKIILMGLLPREQRKNKPMQSLVASVNSDLKSCGKVSGVSFLDVGGLLRKPEYYTNDELHLSTAGYTRILGRLGAALDNIGAVKP